MTPNLDATGHRRISVLASFQFKLEYQKGTDNGTADALSWVPISHSWETIQSLLEGAIVRAANQSVPHVARGVNEAVRWVCGDGHGTSIVADKEAKGMPLPGVAPGLKSITHHLEVNLYVLNEV